MSTTAGFRPARPSREKSSSASTRWPAYEAALRAAKVRYQEYTYPHTQHGFHNDTTPRYDEAAAKLAWARTIAFFNANLRSPNASNAPQ